MTNVSFLLLLEERGRGGTEEVPASDGHFQNDPLLFHVKLMAASEKRETRLRAAAAAMSRMH